jgi:hypothetical protein
MAPTFVFITLRGNWRHRSRCLPRSEPRHDGLKLAPQSSDMRYENPHYMAEDLALPISSLAAGYSWESAAVPQSR